jgi:uncharacterized protein (DUF1810 family)
MNHDKAVAFSRILELQEGIKQTGSYLGTVGRMLTERNEKPEDIKAAIDEIEEIQCYLDWLATR